jgi:hypothetical protein
VSSALSLTAASSSTSLLAICSQHCYAPICSYSIGRLKSKNNPPIDIEERKDANNQHDAESNVSDNEEMDELQREASLQLFERTAKAVHGSCPDGQTVPKKSNAHAGEVARLLEKSVG